MSPLAETPHLPADHPAARQSTGLSGNPFGRLRAGQAGSGALLRALWPVLGIFPRLDSPPDCRAIRLAGLEPAKPEAGPSL
ncbi:MAG: hypothetical protein JSV80_01860, partial [Acidobacteriota bacterium]